MEAQPVAFTVDITDLTGGKPYPTRWCMGLKDNTSPEFQVRLNTLLERMLS